jgi:hypothetical protein
VLCTDRAALRHTDLLATAGDVSILSWPDQADLAADFARGERPQLLLVAPDAAPPEDWNRLTDWIRLPADDQASPAACRSPGIAHPRGQGARIRA